MSAIGHRHVQWHHILGKCVRQLTVLHCFISCKRARSRSRPVAVCGNGGIQVRVTEPQRAHAGVPILKTAPELPSGDASSGEAGPLGAPSSC